MNVRYLTIEKQEEDNEWKDLHEWNSTDNLINYLEDLKSKQGAMIKIYKVDLDIGVIKETKKVT